MYHYLILKTIEVNGKSPASQKNKRVCVVLAWYTVFPCLVPVSAGSEQTDRQEGRARREEERGEEGRDEC